MELNDAPLARSGKTDELNGQSLLRAGFYCSVTTLVLMLATGLGVKMFEDKALDFVIAWLATMGALCFAASIRGGNRLGRELTWCMVGLLALIAAAFLIVPLVR